MNIEVEKKFIRNFLSKSKLDYGKITSIVIIALCALTSLYYWSPSSSFSHLLAANPTSVFSKGEYWRLLTTIFVHADIEHLLSNSLMLFILTFFVTSFYGVKSSVILSYGVGVVVNLIVINQYSTNTTLVGASGIVFYLWGFWLTLYIAINTHLSVTSRFLRVGAIFFILLFPTQYSPTTSYMAHYIGLCFGVLVGCGYYILNKSYIRSFDFWEYRAVVISKDELQYLDKNKSIEILK